MLATALLGVFALFFVFRRSTASGCIDIHPLLIINTVPFFLRIGIHIITLFRLFIGFPDFLDNGILHLPPLFLTLPVFFFPLFASFFFRFLFGTGRLVQRSQVNLTHYIDFRFEFGRTNLEYTIVRRVFSCLRFGDFFLFFH